jgi:hypothetical protein
MALAGSGCARGIGPRSLPVDRTAYIDALGHSWTEQLLYNLVKLRYGDAPTFLDVSSITQAYQLQTGAKAEYTYGWKPPGVTTLTNDTGTTTSTSSVLQDFKHGLTAGVSGQYQTTPTITYTPITGEVMKNAYLKPINTIDLFRALDTGWYPNFILPYCVRSINNLQNKPGTTEFSLLCKIWDDLWDQRAIHIAFEEVQAEKETSKQDNKTSKDGKGPDKPPVKPDKLADNLVEFTDNLVKKQKEKDEEAGKKMAAFIVLDKDRLAPKDKHMVEDFKKLLGLDDTKALREKAKEFLEIDDSKKLKTEQLSNFKAFLEEKDTEKLTAKEEKIRELMGLTPKEPTTLEQEKFKAIGDGKALEKYQVVSGTPPKGVDLNKIYVRTRSPLQVLVMLSQFIDVPDSHKDQANPAKQVLPAGFKPVRIYSSPQLPGTGTFTFPAPDAFAAVKYQKYWFFIRKDDVPTKEVFSGVTGIFLMMEPGKGTKDTPQLTLPVR